MPTTEDLAESVRITREAEDGPSSFVDPTEAELDPEAVAAVAEEQLEDEPEPMLEINPLLLDRDGNQPRFWTEPDWFEISTTIGSNGREIEVLPKPNFSVDEVAKVFFGKGPDWLRWRHGRGDFVLDGVIYEPPRTAAGHRYYTLADIERLATALTQQGSMDAALLQRISIQVKLIAQTYGLVED